MSMLFGRWLGRFHKDLTEPVMKVCEHQVQRSHTFCRGYECLNGHDHNSYAVKIMVVFCQLKLVSIRPTLCRPWP